MLKKWFSLVILISLIVLFFIFLFIIKSGIIHTLFLFFVGYGLIGAIIYLILNRVLKLNLPKIKINNFKKKEWSIIGFIILSFFLLKLIPVLNSGFPLGFDTPGYIWHSELIEKTNNPFAKNIFYEYGKDILTNPPLFNLFLIILSLLTSLSIFRWMLFLPALLSSLIIIPISFILKEFKIKFPLIILANYLILTSYSYLKISWGMHYNYFGLILFFSAIYFLLKYLKNKSNITLIISSLFLLTSFLTHHSLILVSIITLIIYGFINIIKNKKIYNIIKESAPFLISLILSIPYLLFMYKVYAKNIFKNAVGTTSYYLQTGYNISLVNYILNINWILFIFGIIGLIYLTGFNEKRYIYLFSILIPFLLFTIPLFGLYPFSHRFIMMLAIPFSITAGISIQKIIDDKKNLTPILIFLILIISISPIINYLIKINHYPSSTSYPNPTINEKELDGLNFIENNYNRNTTSIIINSKLLDWSIHFLKFNTFRYTINGRENLDEMAININNKQSNKVLVFIPNYMDYFLNQVKHSKNFNLIFYNERVKIYEYINTNYSSV